MTLAAPGTAAVQTASIAEDFDRLAELQSYLRRAVTGTVSSLGAFYLDADNGFARKLEPGAHPQTVAGSSTATCLALLRRTGRLDEGPWKKGFAKWAGRTIAGDWNSARLGADNSYALAFLLQALRDTGCEFNPSQQSTIGAKLDLLTKQVTEGGGRVGINGAPTAFMTFNALIALKRWDRLGPVKGVITDANWTALHEASLLVASGDVDADVFEVAYCVLTASAAQTLSHMTAQERSLLRFAVGQLFRAQRPDGGWPRGRPLFAYPNEGYAYSHDHELLAGLLGDGQLRELVAPWLDHLALAADALAERRHPLTLPNEREVRWGWSSGHHAAAYAESWATASALGFCFALDRLVAETIREHVFGYVKARYPWSPDDRTGTGSIDPDDFIDCPAKFGDPSSSLKKALTGGMITPLVAEAGRVASGQQMSRKSPRSAILYGPPGTSKTQLAKQISLALGWPLLSLDPSHLTRRGLDKVHAEAHTLFGMLERCERIVVLLDEFDELVRERERAGELESRFLTTAMLPKLTALADERRLVFLVATNHLEQFDVAIRRPGRFEVITPVLPPTAEAKTGRWKALRRAVSVLDQHPDLGHRERGRDALADLTYAEAEKLAETIEADSPNPEEIFRRLRRAADLGTLRQHFDPAPVTPATTARMLRRRMQRSFSGRRTWKDMMRDLADRDRGLPTG